MIDIHCHLLPGIDDGPEEIEESIEMCRMAEADGIKTIVATPHFNPGQYEPSSVRVYKLIEELDIRLKEEGIGIRILPGADVAVSSELPVHLKRVEHLTINRGGKYLLAEFPSLSVPTGWQSFLINLIQSGIIPIITHPERNAWFLNNQDALYPAVSRGVMVQITAMSLTGGFGREAQRFSTFLLRHDLAHLIATDAHSTVHRTPILSDAVSIAGDIIGEEKARALVTTIPEAIIENRPLSLPQPLEPIRKSRGWIHKLFSR